MIETIERFEKSTTERNQQKTRLIERIKINPKNFALTAQLVCTISRYKLFNFF